MQIDDLERDIKLEYEKLCVAVKAGDLAAVRVALTNGALNRRGDEIEYWKKPLLAAAKGNQLLIIKCLSQHSDWALAANKFLLDALSKAIFTHSNEVVYWLLKHCNEKNFPLAWEEWDTREDHNDKDIVSLAVQTKNLPALHSMGYRKNKAPFFQNHALTTNFPGSSYSPHRILAESRYLACKTFESLLVNNLEILCIDFTRCEFFPELHFYSLTGDLSCFEFLISELRYPDRYFELGANTPW